MNKANRLILLFATRVLFANTAVSQSSFNFGGGAHSESLAQTGTVFTGVSGMYGNIAGTSFTNGWAADVSYDRPYGLQELSTASVAAIYGAGLGTFGIVAHKNGFDSYSESLVGLSYARRLSKSLSLGGMLDVLQFQQEGFSTATKITFEVSLYSVLTEKIHLGAHIFSPGTVSLTEIQDVPSRFSLGARYFVSKKATLYADVIKISNQTPEFRIAVDHKIHESLALRLGGNISRSILNAGLKVNVHPKVHILAAYSYSNILGGTPSLSLSYGLNNVAPSVL